MSARRDYAKKGKNNKKRAKAANNHMWKVVLLSLTCLAIVLVYYARHDLQKLQLQQNAIIPDEAQQIEKPKFEFYTKLPEAPKVAVQPNLHQGIFQIQLASFKQRADADRLKAELTLNGYNVTVKPVMTDKQSFLRVNVGPYPSLNEAKAALQKLQADNYRGIINRVG